MITAQFLVALHDHYTNTDGILVVPSMKALTEMLAIIKEDRYSIVAIDPLYQVYDFNSFMEDIKTDTTPPDMNFGNNTPLN